MSGFLTEKRVFIFSFLKERGISEFQNDRNRDILSWFVIFLRSLGTTLIDHNVGTPRLKSTPIQVRPDLRAFGR